MPPQIRTQAAVRNGHFPKASFLLYGEPKVGKTTTAASFPSPLVLNVLSENGATHIAGDVTDVNNPADLLSVVRWFKAGEHDYQTIVLDGVSTFVYDAIVRAGGRDTRRAVKEATEDVRPALHEFLSLDCIRVLTGHARRDEEEIEIERRRLTKISVYPDLPPRLRLFVEGRVDAIGYCYPFGGKSQVWWLPLDTESPRPRSIAAGNRLGIPKSTDLSFEAIRTVLVAASA